jgi:hypothetical protein
MSDLDENKESTTATMAWSSINADDVATTGTWFQMDESSITLKDTGTKYYVNELRPDGKFLYRLPPYPKSHERAVVAALMKEANATDKHEIRLFVCKHARTHYLGEWDVVSHVAASFSYGPYILLTRRVQQSSILAQRFRKTKRARSASEAQHLSVLQELLPGWNIVHEPETTSGFPKPYVVDGKCTSWAGDQYTIDYIAFDGNVGRICFESKCSVDDVTEAAIEKCEQLAVGQLTRVVIVAGHDPPRFFDLVGYVWCSAMTMRQRLGLGAPAESLPPPPPSLLASPHRHDDK